MSDTFRWPGTGETVTEAADNVAVPVDVFTGSLATAPTSARRPIVAMDRCNRCHLRLTIHGARNDTRLCVACHAPDATDWMYRPRDLRPTVTSSRTVLLWNPLSFSAEPASSWEFFTADGIEERSINLKTMVHTREVGLVPLVEVDPNSGHQLAREQVQGITWHRVAELNELLLGG